MKNLVDLDVKCEDFLKDNHHFYAHKAGRKKIALISVEVANKDSDNVRLMLGASKLIADERSYHVETPALIIRKFSEFTWDFLVYLIIDFHPVLAAVDAFFLLTGPVYNRRLRKQLHLLSDGEILLGPGECKQALVGFRGVSGEASRLELSYCSPDGEQRQLPCAIR
ncbi:MAG: hypothetical protein WD278_20825 [Pirellulales bacterium]